MTGDESNRGGTSGGAASVDSFARSLRDEAVWAEPPADLLDRIISAGRGGAADPASGGAGSDDGPPDADEMPLAPVVPLPKRTWIRTLVSIAAASVAVFGAGFLVGIARDDDRPVAAEDELVAQLALVGTDLAPAAAASVDVFDRGAGYALILQTTGLEPAPVGDYYEGWLSSADDVAVSIGTFHMRGGDGTVVLWSGVAVAEFPQLIVRRHTAGSPGDDAVVMTGTYAADA